MLNNKTEVASQIYNKFLSNIYEIDSDYCEETITDLLLDIEYEEFNSYCLLCDDNPPLIQSEFTTNCPTES